MARIELSNIGGGTTLSLTTTGTSGASTLAGSVLNIPIYQGQLTLTTTGTSGAATLSGDILNIPQYSGGGTPAGSTGQIQYNNAGAFGASANLAWDNSNVRLNIGAPSAPTGRLNVKGSGTLTTVNTRLTNSGDTELLKVLDNGNTNIGAGFNWDNANGRLGIGTASPSALLHITSTSTQLARFVMSSGNILMQINNNGYVGFYNSISNFPTWFNTSVAGTGLSIEQTISASTSNRTGVTFYTANNNTAGVCTFYEISGVFNPTSGTSIQSALRVANEVNQTGGSSGITRGIHVSPILTSAADYRAIEFSNNSGYGIYGVGTASNYLAGNTAIGTTTPSARLHVRGSNTSSGTNAFLVQNSTPSDLHKIENDGKITYWATNTAAGTTGAQTIDRPSGTVNFGIGAGSLVVTNSLCTTSSIVFATVRTNDATAYIKNVVPAAGSFTINLGANATAETSVGFFIIN